MKVTGKSVFVGDTLRGENRQAQLNEETKGSGKKKSFFAGGLFEKQDKYLFNKNAAQQRAMKVFTDATKNELSMDDDVRKRKDSISSLKEENDALYEEVKEYRALMAKAKEEHGITAEDEKLMEKAEDPKSELTEEEQNRLSQIREDTDYNSKMKQYGSYLDQLQENMDKNDKSMHEMESVNASLEKERLKEHKMLDAKILSEDMLEKAAKAAALTLIGEAKDHIDEEMEKKVEEAEEAAQKKAEQEEKIEDAKESKEANEEFVQSVQENVGGTTETLVHTEQGATDIQQQIKKIIQEEKILEEDLKGAAVNQTC